MLDIEAVLRAAMKLPGVKIGRESFLRKELSKHFGKEQAEKAVATTPAQAGLTVKDLEKIAKSSIQYETAKVTALSAATGIPGGVAMAATIPADLAQFFGHAIRVIQKLAYLYGWQDLMDDGQSEWDDETSMVLTLFLGAMLGVGAATSALGKIAEKAAVGVEKTLMQKALTKGTLYPLVKKIAKVLGVKMTKEVFAKGAGKVVPVVGAVVSGALTLVSFRPMAKRLQAYLTALPTASVDFYEKKPNRDAPDVLEMDFSDIVVEGLEEPTP